MRTARRTDAAERDLHAIAFQIALVDGHLNTADRIIDELIAQCDKLAEFSETAIIGTSAEEIGPGVRLLSYKRWVILFRYASGGVDILRFADGSQDYLAWRL